MSEFCRQRIQYCGLVALAEFMCTDWEMEMGCLAQSPLCHWLRGCVV